jgi:hypothetical protein
MHGPINIKPVTQVLGLRFWNELDSGKCRRSSELASFCAFCILKTVANRMACYRVGGGGRMGFKEIGKWRRLDLSI